MQTFEHVFDVFLWQAALEGLKVRFLDRVSVFFSVAGRLGGLPTPPQPKKVLFFARVSFFFAVEGRLRGFDTKKSDLLIGFLVFFCRRPPWRADLVPGTCLVPGT